MVGGAATKLGALELEEVLPELADEDAVTIAEDGLRHAMEAEDLTGRVYGFVFVALAVVATSNVAFHVTAHPRPSKVAREELEGLYSKELKPAGKDIWHSIKMAGSVLDTKVVSQEFRHPPVLRRGADSLGEHVLKWLVMGEDGKGMPKQTLTEECHRMFALGENRPYAQSTSVGFNEELFCKIWKSKDRCRGYGVLECGEGNL
ncbi:hypothetical protein ACLB2K_048010 [Fragaria x ananassa]